MSITKNKIVIVGGSQGVGFEIGKLLGKENNEVILCSRNESKLKEATGKLGGKTSFQILDYLDRISIKSAFEKIGDFNHLILTAVADENKKTGKFFDLTPEIAHSSFDKFWGFFNVLQFAVPGISTKGSITLTSGLSAVKPSKNGGMSLLGCNNAAVINLAFQLSIELAPIRVNCVTPGAMLTGVWDKEQTEGLKKWMINDLPVQALGNPDIIAEAFIYLIGNSYTTGINLVIDGGLSLT